MLGENIKNLRKAKNLSQDELAGKLNVVRQTVSKWEKGLSLPDAQLLVKIADVFDVTVSELLGETKEKSEDKETIEKISKKLEEANGKLKEINEKKKRFKKNVLLTASLIFSSAFICYGIKLITLFKRLNLESSALSFIGGADGPTAIFVTSNPIPQIDIIIKLIISLLAAAISIIALIKLRKNN